MARAAASLLIAGLGGMGAFAVTTSSGEDGPAPGSATIYRTVTERETYQGRGIHWWASRAVANRRQANTLGARSETLTARVRALQRSLRGRFTSGLHGVVDAFLCIHKYEGGWGADTGNGYHGGLQMDGDFMGQYGGWALRRWGDAENWPAEVQVIVALTAYYSGRGFYPWPNTARMCGLL